MNIVLISPYPYIAAPGLRIISACLKRDGHNTKIIFMPKEIGEKYDEESLNLIAELTKNSDLIGVSLMTNFFFHAIQITERIKKERKVPIIWGGVHPTVRPEECLKYADIVCRSEGEETMIELAKKMERGESYRDVKNLCFLDEKGNLISNPIRPLIQNLDSLPFPDDDLKNQYVISDGKLYKMAGENLKKFWGKFDYTGYFYTILMSRGCPFSCTYCCNNTFNKLYSGQSAFRRRSVKNVIEELKIMKTDLPFIECVFINDDHLLGLSLEYIKEFSEKYRKYINLPMIIVGVHPTVVNEEKLNYLVQAGPIAFLAMGIQSGSEKIKKIFKRNYPNSEIEKAAKIINKFKEKIQVICFEVIIDNPWQTDKDSADTLMLLSKLPKPYYMNIFSLIFYPGTELYDLAKREGLIKDEKKEIYQKNYLSFYQKTYFNKLFFLMKKYGTASRRIYPAVMFLLTKKFLRKIYLSRILYEILNNYIDGGWIAQTIASRKKILKYFK